MRSCHPCKITWTKINFTSTKEEDTFSCNRSTRSGGAAQTPSYAMEIAKPMRGPKIAKIPPKWQRLRTHPMFKHIQLYLSHPKRKIQISSSISRIVGMLHNLRLSRCKQRSRRWRIASDSLINLNPLSTFPSHRISFNRM